MRQAFHKVGSRVRDYYLEIMEMVPTDYNLGMKQRLVRAIAKARRTGVSILNYDPKRFTSLVRLEKEPEINFDELGVYSEPRVIEISDPRNGRNTGHYFQERKVYLLKDVILEPRQGLVFSPNGNLIKESTVWDPYVSHHFFPWNPGKTKVLDINQNAIFISSNSYYHWLIEDLATTITALKYDVNAPILVANNPPRYVKEFIATLDREVMYLNGPVQLKSLVLVGKSNDSGWPHPIDIENILNYEPFSQVISKESPNSKLYASRRASLRSPKNEELVENVFKENGFRIVRLEELSLIDEIHEISKVKFWAGVHGAGIINLVWMSKGSKVLDIANESYWTEANHRAARIKQLDYRNLIYTGPLLNAIPIVDLRKKLQEFD